MRHNGSMVTFSGAVFVLWIHVIAACVWIGGQITLGMLMPALRVDRAIMSGAAKRFGNYAWVAFALLIITGIINMHEAGISWSNLNGTPEARTLSIKLLFVLLSGTAAAAHAYWATPRLRDAPARTRALALGGLGGLSLLAALAAALFGVAIAQR